MTGAPNIIVYAGADTVDDGNQPTEILLDNFAVEVE